MTIHIASGIALAMAVYAAGGVTGGHVNPSITLTMCILGRTPWRYLPVYWLGQYTGSFLAAVVLYGEYYDALNAYDGGVRAVFGINGTAGLWTTFPAEFVSVGNGFFDQIVCTALLLMCVLSIFDPKNMNPSNGLIPIALGAMFTTLGMSFGVNFGYAVNPARDLAPRVFVAIAGWGTEVFSFKNYSYFWIPLLGPHCGSIIGAAIYQIFVGVHFPEPEKKHKPGNFLENTSSSMER
ncbi:hypothetical protein NP493_326g01001 [Ridgeia piscesae]|uniref:Aquaporin-3 n=1 Tax=Ridgeia piscesae TaxID=27915 RepID=A0AAD9NWC1_RIDPI|nr:hypothetical protein NP493_326g01001 [Ridgeia piscesae]